MLVVNLGQCKQFLFYILDALCSIFVDKRFLDNLRGATYLRISVLAQKYLPEVAITDLLLLVIDLVKFIMILNCLETSSCFLHDKIVQIFSTLLQLEA